MEEVLAFLKQCGTYYLATQDGDHPRVRPFGTIDLYDGALHIQTGRSKAVAQQMLENPHVELCAFDGEQWLRIQATVEEDPRVEAQEHMLEHYPSLRANYTPGDGNTMVFALKDVTATFSSFTAPSRTIQFS